MTHDEAKALTYGDVIYHKTLRNADGSMVRARCNGKVRLWKRRPGDYQVPMKYGLRYYFYLTPGYPNLTGDQIAKDWSLTDTLSEERNRALKIKRRADACFKLGLIGDVPDCVLRDALMDNFNYDDALAKIVAFID